MSAPLVALRDAVVERRGRRILGPLSTRVGAGGITLVIGPNGAGKSTLLRVLHGIERLSEGRRDAAVPPAEQAFVFQTPVMLRRSVAANLDYPLRLVGMSRDRRTSRIADWAARIRLAGRLDLLAPRLSGGERQKLALARALIRQPRLLFADEPCANLDGRSTREIEALLTEAAASGTRIVMASHDLGQARRLATDAIFLLGGRLHEAGPAASILTDPARPETRAFLRGDIVE